jgi:hypothetical protein
MNHNDIPQKLFLQQMYDWVVRFQCQLDAFYGMLTSCDFRQQLPERNYRLPENDASFVRTKLHYTLWQKKHNFG